ncbi:hypothetical protein DL771_005542 [Monosporascus sp. 5C6A]|nr:hypothetical protein DL771_005542 [Monosporascus sp. 5C6A]
MQPIDLRLIGVIPGAREHPPSFQRRIELATPTGPPPIVPELTREPCHTHVVDGPLREETLHPSSDNPLWEKYRTAAQFPITPSTIPAEFAREVDRKFVRVADAMNNITEALYQSSETCRATLATRFDNFADDFAGLKGQVDVLTTALKKGQSVDDAIEYHLRDFMGSDDFRDAVKTATKDASDISKTATAVFAVLKDEISAFVKKQVSIAITKKTAKVATPNSSVSLAAPPAAFPTSGVTRKVSSPAAPSSVVSFPAPSSVG